MIVVFPVNLYTIKPFHSDGFPMHVNRISMELPIVYFMGQLVEISKLAVTHDFQQYGILTSVDSYEPCSLLLSLETTDAVRSVA